MSTPKRKLILGLSTWVLLSSAATALVACGDDSSNDGRTGFEPSDAGSDAVANLPETSVPADGGRDADAGQQRGPFDPTDEPVTCAGSEPCVKQIVGGAEHFCALMSDGTVRCWGKDDYGALGGGPPPKGPGTPTKTTLVYELTNVTQISAGRSTTCARRDDGTVYCWGKNFDGQLGLDDVQPSRDFDAHPTPSPVALRDPAVRVDVGDLSVCAVLETGAVSCWGSNQRAQLARPVDPDSDVLGPGLAALAPFKVGRIGVGSATALGLTSTGEVVSWGEIAGGRGVLGGRVTSISPDPAPNSILDLKGVTTIAARSTRERLPPGGWNPSAPRISIAQACAVAGGEVYCWGRSDVGALCTGLPDPQPLPTHSPIKGKAWPQQLALGDELTCARMTDGSVQCCGADGRGRLGTGQTAPFTAFFQPVASVKGHAVQVAASDHAVCALLKDGTVECWGSNASGELATGTTDDDAHASPVKVTF
jgi:alpha-tubulin suppressor-like RCC1 family protein